MDYFHSKQNFVPETGNLLVSEPYLPDPNFERTVVLICSHDNQGTFGLVLNKLANLKFDEVMENVKNFDENLYVGGPVQQDTLHFIHQSNDPSIGGIEIQKGLFWGGNFETLISKIQSNLLNPKDFRFFLGYSGWTGGQLEEEIKAKSWIVYKKATTLQIMETEPNQLWKVILASLGGKFKMFANYPTDPRMN